MLERKEMDFLPVLNTFKRWAINNFQSHFLNVHKVHSEEAAKRSKPAEARIAEMLPKIEERVRAAKEPSKLELKDICAAFVQKIYPSGDQ
ncbi:MAG: hypothetical protein EOP04_29960, partial [Proteobacteria bacterium]